MGEAAAGDWPGAVRQVEDPAPAGEAEEPPGLRAEAGARGEA